MDAVENTIQDAMRMDSLDEFKTMVIAMIGALTGFWGWKGWLTIGWIVCMMVDWLTGNMEARRNGTWSSKIARDGIWHKVGMVFVVGVACGVDLILNAATYILPDTLPFRYPGLICPIVMLWYVVTELGSIAENAYAMGAPVPSWLLKALAVAKDATDKAGSGIAPAPEANGDDDHGE